MSGKHTPLSISLIIPTLNAGQVILPLLNAISEQSVRVMEVAIVDSSSDDETVPLASGYSDLNVSVHVISRSEFDHGMTRHQALELTTGDLVVFLTQDAHPADEQLIKNLISPMLCDDSVGMSYGRQLPKKSATRFEQLIREYNYPNKSSIRSASEIGCIGIKAFFASDTCAAYRRDAYEAVGGFERPCSTNEDMFMAAKLMKAGYKVAYCANAKVYHSHNFTFIEQFRRNKASAYERANHSDLLDGVSETNEGIKLVKYVSLQLVREGRYLDLGKFGVDCLARFSGTIAGKMMAG